MAAWALGALDANGLRARDGYFVGATSSTEIPSDSVYVA